MNKSEISRLLTGDVDDVSDVAYGLGEQNRVTALRNAAEMLKTARAGGSDEKRLFVLKLLRFIQAAVAGSRVPIPAPVAAEIVRAIPAHQSPEILAAGSDVLQLIEMKMPETSSADRHR